MYLRSRTNFVRFDFLVFRNNFVFPKQPVVRGTASECLFYMLVYIEIWSEGAISLGPRSRTQPDPRGGSICVLAHLTDRKTYKYLKVHTCHTSYIPRYSDDVDSRVRVALLMAEMKPAASN